MAIDPTCTYGPEGTAYITALTYEFKLLPFYKSTDSGRTWAKPVNLPVRQGMDREYITVDNTASKLRGQVYLHATGFIPSIDGQNNDPRSEIRLWRFAGAGTTLLGPTSLGSKQADRRMGPLSNGVVLSDGTFVVIAAEINHPGLPFDSKPYRPVGRILAVSSSDKCTIVQDA